MLVLSVIFLYLSRRDDPIRLEATKVAAILSQSSTGELQNRCPNCAEIQVSMSMILANVVFIQSLYWQLAFVVGIGSLCLLIVATYVRKRL